jgi:DHA1 family bicyclomycin/chloramphenicol resistance-like MFS transporter
MDNPITSVRPSYAMLIAISAVGPLALNIFMPSMPGLQSEFSVSYGVAQLTLTLYLIGMAVCQLVYGPISDRVGRRPMLLFGMALFVVASVMAALAPSIHVLIAARLLQAVGGAAGIVLARAMVRDVFDRETSASVISYITMAFVVAPMVAPAIGGYIDVHGGWRLGFWVLAGLGGAVLAAAWFHLPETHVNRSATGSGMSLLQGAVRLFALKRFRGYTLVLAFTSSVFFAFLGGAPHIMMDVLGRTPMEYGLWFICVSAGYMAGNFLSGRYTMAVGLDRMIMTGCVITLLGGLMCFAAAVTGLLSPATLFLPMCIAALGNGLTIPNGTAGAISVDQRLTGAAAGWSGFAQMACGAAASQLVGSLQDGWPTTVFWFMAMASLLALICHMAAVRHPDALQGPIACADQAKPSDR